MPKGIAHFNYRVVKTGDMLSIHEVHYDSGDDSHPTGCTQNPTPVLSEDIEGIKWVLNAMLGALKKPILTDKDFNK